MFPYQYQHSQSRPSWKRVAEIMRGHNWESQQLAPHERMNSIPIDISKEEENFVSYFKEIYEGRDGLDEISLKTCVQKLYEQAIEPDAALDKNTALAILPWSDEDLKELYLMLVNRLLGNNVTDLVNRLMSNNVLEDVSVMKNKIVAFLSESNKRRKYHFYEREKLISTCSVYGIKFQPTNMEKTIITKIVLFEEDERLSNDRPAESYDDVKMKSIGQVLCQSFQTRFVGAKRAACEVGHKNESLIAEKFVHDVEDGHLTGVCNLQKVLGVFTTGLVAKKGQSHVKDSIDLILLVETFDGEKELWGCEVKTRVAASEAAKEVTFQRLRHGQHGSGTKRYTQTFSTRTFTNCQSGLNLCTMHMCIT